MISADDLRSLVKVYRGQYEKARAAGHMLTAVNFAARVDRAERDLHMSIYGVPPWAATC